jgi:hypothetical protein
MVGSEKARSIASGLFLARFHVRWAKQAAKPALGKMMANGDKKTKDATPKKEPASGSKVAEGAPKAEGVKTEGAKTEGVKAESAKTDAAPSRKGMGEGQKPVSQAYKDNWNAIFGKKKKR